MPTNRPPTPTTVPPNNPPPTTRLATPPAILRPTSQLATPLTTSASNSPTGHLANAPADQSSARLATPASNSPTSPPAAAEPATLPSDPLSARPTNPVTTPPTSQPPTPPINPPVAPLAADPATPPNPLPTDRTDPPITPPADPPNPNNQPRATTRPTRAAAAAQTALTTLAALTDLVLPTRCAGCGTPGHPLCLHCAATFNGPFDVHRPLTATGPPIHALAPYRDTARLTVLTFKERGRRDLATPLGRMIAAVLPALDTARPAEDGTWWLVPTPSRRSAARRRGGPHILRLARATAAALASRGEPAAVAPALRLAPDVRDSAGLDAAARITNLAGRVRRHPPGAPPPGTPVVLLDDVVTTGATAAACIRELTHAGLVPTAVVALTAT